MDGDAEGSIPSPGFKFNEYFSGLTWMAKFLKATHNTSFKFKPTLEFSGVVNKSTTT